MNDRKQALDNFSQQMLNSAINGINEAVSQKDQIIKELKQKLANCTCQKEVKHE